MDTIALELATESAAAAAPWPTRVECRVRESTPGRIYQVAVSAHRHARAFDDDALARRVASVAASRRLWRDTRVLAWVLMPDHWQGLIELGHADTLPTAIGRMKAVTARLARPLLPDHARLWSAAFRERALPPDEDVVAAARRLIAHPLRARLVERVGDYPYWDAVWL